MIFNLAIPDQLYNGLILVVLTTIVDLIHKDDDRKPYSFFWLAGVARDDRLHRVVVECPAQGNSRQCSNCLRWSAHPTNPCGFSAKAGACRRSGARCTLSTYFRKLQTEEGYCSVRDLHKFEDHKNSLSSDFFISLLTKNRLYPNFLEVLQTLPDKIHLFFIKFFEL